MPIIAKEGESKIKQIPPAGTHVARCYSVIDMGTQNTPFGESHKIRITWELPTETAVFKEGGAEEPFAVGKEYTLSLYEKANLRHDLESWRGKAFTEEQLGGFDISTLLGAACLLGVIHKPGKENKTYANVASVSALPKGMKVPEQINPSVEYSINEGRNTTFQSLPQWLQKKIEGSLEFSETGGATQEDTDSQIPF